MSKGRHIHKRGRHPAAPPLPEETVMTELAEPTVRQISYVSLRDPEVAHQLSARVRQLARAARETFGSWRQGTEPSFVEAAADALYRNLMAGGCCGPDAARTIMRNLVSRAEAEEPAFWETGLGRVLALYGAYPEPSMPRVVAGALLDVTKQRIAQMVAAHLLELDASRFISTASVVRLMEPAE